MPAMSTPLKALIQERLRAKIVRQTDDEFEYESEMYPPHHSQQPAALQTYDLGECKPVATASMGSGTMAAFPLRLHTHIDPSAYIPHAHPLSAREYLHSGPSPSFARSNPTHGRHHHHLRQPHQHAPPCSGDSNSYRDQFQHRVYNGKSHGVSTQEMLSPAVAKHHDLVPATPQHSNNFHSRRWPEKTNGTTPNHRSVSSGPNGDFSDDRQGYRHEGKRGRRQEHPAESNAHAPNNQMWHDADPAKDDRKRRNDKRSDAQCVRSPSPVHQPQTDQRDSRPLPTPLDIVVIQSHKSTYRTAKTRSLDQILSPDSRRAAKAFVEKRQRRSRASTPRTLATQRWLQSLDLRAAGEEK